MVHNELSNSKGCSGDASSILWGGLLHPLLFWCPIMPRESKKERTGETNGLEFPPSGSPSAGHELTSGRQISKFRSQVIPRVTDSLWPGDLLQQPPDLRLIWVAQLVKHPIRVSAQVMISQVVGSCPCWGLCAHCGVCLRVSLSLLHLLLPNACARSLSISLKESPGEPYCCAPCEWRRKWVSLP